MDFLKFKRLHQKHFEEVIKNADYLFETDVSKDVIWETYLNTFPESEKQGFNCNSCKHFLRPFGNIVAIKNNKTITIWDFKCDEPYQKVVDTLHELIIKSPIINMFCI